jgi:mRNA interferase MazF
MKRGDVFDARLDPTEGSEQAGTRPVVIVSRDAINASSPVVIGVPCTTMRPGRHIFPSQVVLHAPDGGLNADSVALGEQVRTIAKSRLTRQRGALSRAALAQLDRALTLPSTYRRSQPDSLA